MLIDGKFVAFAVASRLAFGKRIGNVEKAACPICAIKQSIWEMKRWTMIFRTRIAGRC